jgi:transcriptional regulator with XRE-family HTH domain
MSKEKGYSATQASTRMRDMELKTILKKLIQEKGITITALSRSTKVPLQTLQGWLQGSEPKSLKQVKKVADHLGVDLDYLCFGIEPKKTSLDEYREEINAGIFEVVLRRIKK